MKKFCTILSVALIAVLCLLVLVSCGEKSNNDYDETVENLKKHGYLVEGGKTPNDQSVKAALRAEKEDDEDDFIIIYWCSSEYLAKVYYETMKRDAEEHIKSLEKQIEEATYADAKKELQEQLALNKKLIIDVKGLMVWKGSAEAIKATKK